MSAADVGRLSMGLCQSVRSVSQQQPGSWKMSERLSGTQCTGSGSLIRILGLDLKLALGLVWVLSGSDCWSGVGHGIGTARLHEQEVRWQG